MIEVLLFFYLFSHWEDWVDNVHIDDTEHLKSSSVGKALCQIQCAQV